MKKRIAAMLLCILLLATVTTSCKIALKPNKDPAPSDTPEISNTEDTAQTDDTNITEQVPESKEEAPEIPENAGGTVLATLESGCEIHSDIDCSKYFVFIEQKGEEYLYGIVDIDGNIVVEPTYTLLGWCDWHEVIYAEPFAEGDSPVVLDENYKIDLHYGHGGGASYRHILDKNQDKMFSFYFNYDSMTLTEISEMEALVPYIVYSGDEPIIAGDYNFGENSWYERLDAVLYSGEPMEYEFITDKGGTASLGSCDYVPPSFVNDYLLVCRNGKYGYVDGLGRECSEFSYDEAMPAYDEKAWVKKDGVWQVIKLK